MCSRRGVAAGKSRCSRGNPKMAFLAEWGVLSGNFIVLLGKLIVLLKRGVLRRNYNIPAVKMR